MKKLFKLLERIIELLEQSKSKKRWLTPATLEAEYDLKENTMSKYRICGKVPFSKIGTKIIRYDRKKIDEWLENHEVI